MSIGWCVALLLACEEASIWTLPSFWTTWTDAFLIATDGYSKLVCITNEIENATPWLAPFTLYSTVVLSSDRQALQHTRSPWLNCWPYDSKLLACDFFPVDQKPHG